MGASLTMIDRHYGHLARDGREHASRACSTSSAPDDDRRLRATDVRPRGMEPCRTSRPVTLGDDLEWATGSWWPRLSPVLAEAGVELRLLALWCGEFVLLRFQDYRDEYPSATAPATLATSRRCRVETLGSARATTRMPGRVSSGRRLCASRHLRATILQLFPTYENIAKIPVQ
jgi:hypothetical protein